jgi:Flp pilus assembly protein TadD
VAEKFVRLDPNERDFYLTTQGWAYPQLGQWQEAISVLPRSTPFPWVHLWLAVDYVELGRDDAARAEIAQLLKLDPQYSLKIGATEFPANQQHAATDLRKAGLN